MVVPFHDIVAIEPKNTAILFPNAILVSTLHHRYIFASFIFRDQALKLITNAWKISVNITDEKDSLLASADSKSSDAFIKRKNKNLKDDCGVHQSISIHPFRPLCSRHAFLEKLNNIQDANIEDPHLGTIIFKQTYITKSDCDIELEYVNDELNLSVPVCLRISLDFEDADNTFIEGRLEFYVPSQIVFRDSFSLAVKEIFLLWLGEYLANSRVVTERDETYRSFFSGRVKLAIGFIFLLFSILAGTRLRTANVSEEFEISLLDEIIMAQKQRMHRDAAKLLNAMK